MGDMVEKVARALAARKMALEDGGVNLPDDLFYQCFPDARAALEASCHDELVEVAKSAANCFPGHQTAVMANTVLKKVKDEGHG